MIHFIHGWSTLITTATHEYQQCSKCGKRRVKSEHINFEPVEGYQPADKEWDRHQVTIK